MRTAGAATLLFALSLLVVPGAGLAQSSPIAAYGLNAAGGTRAADYSGSNLSGELQTGAAWTTAGEFGGALLLNGQAGYVDLGNPAALRFSGSMTVSAWIYSSDFPADDAAIVSKLDGYTPLGFQLDTTADTGPRTIGFKLTNAQGALMIRYGATTLQLNTWYYVTGVYDASAQTLNVYLNGALDNGALSGTVTSSQLDAPLNVLIGERADYGAYPFIGLIDEVRIYNSALTQAQVQADMNAAVVPASPDAVAPTAPSSLVASAASNSQVNLAWVGSSDNYDVTAYPVERCQGADCENFVQIGGAGDIAFRDAGLNTATTYRYRVRATDGAGNFSAYSNIVTATTLSVPIVGGRVGAYPFDEGSGGTAVDFSGLGDDGTLINAPAWTSAGSLGNALTFGNSAYVDLGNPGPLQLIGSMTVSAWIKASAFPADDAAIVSKLTIEPPRGFQLDTTVDTGVRTIGFKLSNVAGYMIRYGATTLQLNTWYHVTGVYDADARTISVYLNGVADNGNLFGTVAGSQKDSPLSVNIGRRASGGYGFEGTIDEVRIYNRALSQAEVQADMNASATSASLSLAPAGQSSSGGVDVTALSLQQGSSGTLTVTISPAQTTDTSVSIATSATGVVAVPASVIVPAGVTSAPVTVTGVAPGTAEITASLGGATATIQVVVNPAVGVSVDSSIAGAVVASDNATVSGTFSGPSNTGITVNGIVAAIVGNTFVVPDVPLQPGVNTLTVVLTTPGGQTTTSTISVTSTGPAPIEVSATPAQGTAPLGVTFTINNRTHNAIQSVQADYSGTGNFVNASPNLLSNTYTASGIYQARFVVTDSTGATYQQTVPIAVQDSAQIDQMLRATWSGFSAVLAAQDTTQALQHFNAQAQAKYGPVLSALLPSLPQIVASFSAPQLMSVSGEVGEYVVSRTINGVNQNFFIYFARDSDGVWRLDSM